MFYGYLILQSDNYRLIHVSYTILLQKACINNIFDTFLESSEVQSNSVTDTQLLQISLAYLLTLGLSN